MDENSRMGELSGLGENSRRYAQTPRLPLDDSELVGVIGLFQN